MTMYPNTIAAVRLRADRAPGDDAAHLVDMCAEVEAMTDRERAGRWVGWMLCKAETLGWWDNTTSRDLVRVDVSTVADHRPRGEAGGMTEDRASEADNSQEAAS